MKIIGDLLGAKYGKQYSEACKKEAIETISEKLKHKLSIHTPPKLLVEKYLMEIANNYNIDYDPDPNVMKEEHPEKSIHMGFLFSILLDTVIW